jgi:chaperonin cofactor prefoldin
MDILMAHEVAEWLLWLRETDPGTAGLVDEALAALRAGGTSLGPPLAVPLEVPLGPTRPDLDYAYQRQLEMLTRVRRAAADIATSRKRLELQINQLERTTTKLQAQRAEARQAGQDGPAGEAGARLAAMAAQLANLQGQYAGLQAEEERVTVASQRLQGKVDAFRTRKETAEAAQAAAEAAIEDAIAEAAEPDSPDIAGPPDADLPRSPVMPSPLPLSELRPGAPERSSVRVLFTVESPATAVVLAAGTERDWLDAWYAEAIVRSRTRYERDRGGTG